MVGTSSIAAALAVLPTRDDTPRVIKQFTSVFLVTRVGELWRVFDSDTPDAAERHMPSSRSVLPHRVFVALAQKSQIRVHTFAPDEDRDVDPTALQTQLDVSAVH